MGFCINLSEEMKNELQENFSKNVIISCKQCNVAYGNVVSSNGGTA